eukprot:TRINITY_DN15798_c0_g1_i1.p1 TRINITY_DN15798_c0_g1~~TRINITY_DN15798_c0_g1_i1.p1  ORF type:complete len:400 (-),score=67.30 TRINITY_DN15798_c0_g1_i1:216-1415(-)
MRSAFDGAGVSSFDPPASFSSQPRDSDSASRRLGGGNYSAHGDAPFESRFVSDNDRSALQGDTQTRESLDQLASIFQIIAGLDSKGELNRLSSEVLGERKDLELQLSRRSGLEQQLQQARNELDALREERRRIEIEATTNRQHIAHLQDELLVVEREVKETSQDLASFQEAADLTQGGDFGRRKNAAPYSSPEEERRDVLSKVRAERELLQRDQHAIDDLRSKLDVVFKEKRAAQEMQESLLEKQRQAEQDRGLMLTAIEAERGKLSQMRAERIGMWEERCRLERETTDLAQERWLTEHAPISRQSDLVRGPGVPSSTSEFRGDVQQPRRHAVGIPREDATSPYDAFAQRSPVDQFGRAGELSLSQSSDVAAAGKAFGVEVVRDPLRDARGVRNDPANA